jgi:hypothetical protein
MSGEFVLFVYEKEPAPRERSIITVREWMTELPQIGHTIQFSDNNRFIHAKIQDIIWNLGDAQGTWMKGGTIQIIAVSTQEMS